jgi:hypothetical protein
MAGRMSVLAYMKNYFLMASFCAVASAFGHPAGEHSPRARLDLEAVRGEFNEIRRVSARRD